MSENAAHCEAKLHGFRRTQDGVVVSFVIHPAEIPQALALDPLGTRYMLAFAQIGDDEQPVPPAGSHQPQQKAPTQPPRPAGEPHKERYAAMPPAEQAVTRAALLPKDERFRAWVSEQWGHREISEEDAAVFIRSHCCSNRSRKLIAEVPEYLDRFLKMETQFKVGTGQMAEAR